MHREFIRPTKPLEASTKCPSFDRRLRFITPGIAFCYRERLEPSRLRSALERVLNDFSVFSGRLSDRHGVLHVEHGVGGVPLEFVKRSESSRELAVRVGANFESQKLLLPNISVLRSRRRVPMLAARLTHTADGSVLGVTWNHAAGDMHSLMLLLRSWANAYRGCAYDKPLQVQDPAAYLNEHLPNPPAGQSMHMASWTEWLRFGSSLVSLAIRPVTLRFTWEELLRLQATAQREKSITVQDGLAAHIYMRVCRLHAPDAKALLHLAINYRKRLQLPSNLLGNFIDVVRTTVAPSDDIASVAANLRSNIEAFPRSALYQHELARLEAEHTGWAQRMRFVYSDVDLRSVALAMTVSSWAGFGIYELAFEASNPVWVETKPIDQGNWFANVFETPGDAGLTVRAWLPSKLASSLEREHARGLTAPA